MKTTATLGDKRLDRRAKHIVDLMTENCSGVIHRISCVGADLEASYRLVNNPSVSYEKIQEMNEQRLKEIVRTKRPTRVLCLQDTTELNYESHRARMSKNGHCPLEVSNKQAGQFAHVGLCICEGASVTTGISYMKLWGRTQDYPNKQERGQRFDSAAGKESSRWLEAARHTKKILSDTGVNVVYVGDRENDLFEYLVLKEEGIDFIVRASQNRNLMNGIKINEQLESLPSMRDFTLKVKGGHGIKPRTAQMHAAYAAVDIKAPCHKEKFAKRESVQLNVVHVWESPTSSEEKYKPIRWILYTTLSINSIEEMNSIIEDYRNRWTIEEFFRVLQSKGFRIEDSQIETTKALRNNIALAMSAALLVVTLKKAVDAEVKDIRDDEVFSERECELMESIEPVLEKGAMPNPYAKHSLAWAAWIIARVGNWFPTKQVPKPSYIRITTGLNKFMGMTEVFDILMQNKTSGENLNVTKA